ncbi:hypothetical protein BDR26DRAFT_861909 [Obelidium mucronatum]|nr:hypothetical protein BDR26DRAFT_861909 [Obelidium mucronatum]
MLMPIKDMKLINLSLLTLACVKANSTPDYLNQVVSDLESALSLDSKCLQTAWILGNIKFENGDYEAAKHVFERALEQPQSKPLPAYYLNQLGCTCAHLRRYDMSLIYFQCALEIDPECIEAIVGCCHLFRVLNYTDMERKKLTLLVKKIIGNFQTLPPQTLPHNLQPILKIIRLASLISPKEACTMLSILYPQVQRHSSSFAATLSPPPQERPQQQSILSCIPLQTFQRIYGLYLIQVQGRRKARAIARALLQQDEWDFVAGVIVGRCAVFGKRIATAADARSDENMKDIDSGGEDPPQVEIEWGMEGEEVNIGEEVFSVQEAEDIVERCCVGVLRVFYQPTATTTTTSKYDTRIPETVIKRLEGDESLNWILKDEENSRDLLRESLANLSIIKWMLGKYADAQKYASQAYELAPPTLAVTHNYALILYRLGAVKSACKIWMFVRIPGLQHVSAVVSLSRDFWIHVAKEMVCGTDLLRAFEIAVEAKGSVVLKGLWKERRKLDGGGENVKVQVDSKLYRWMDLTCVRFLVDG